MRRVILAIMTAGGLLLAGACDPEAAPPAAAPERTAQATPGTESEGAVAGASPVVEKRTVTTTRKIAFKTRKVKDATLAKGDTKVVKRGATGLKELTYEVTLTNGAETGRKLVREVVRRRPVTRVIAVGTKQARQCDPNYSGCVPIARDVDCAGGSGDGPRYVSGPVRVVGDDIYDLDRDGDGIACDT